MAKQKMNVKMKLDVWDLVFELDDTNGTCDIKCTREATKDDDQKSVKDGKVTKEFKKVAVEILSDKGNPAPFGVALQAIIKGMGYMSPEEVKAEKDKAIEEILAELEEEDEEEPIEVEAEPEYDDDYNEYDPFYEWTDEYKIGKLNIRRG